MVDAGAALERFRDEHAGVFAMLWRRLGEFDLVDVSLADAYLAAIAAWPDGIPSNPATWMATVALSATTGVVTPRRHDAEPATPQADLQVLLAACCADGLTPEQREVLLVRAAAGLMMAELATLLAVPETEIRRRLEGAKTGLRKLGGRAAAQADVDGRVARVHAAIDRVRAAPGAEATAVADLLASRATRAFG